MRFLCYVVCVLGLIFSSFSQILDLARIEYLRVPGDNSNFDYSRRRILFNVPFRIPNKAYLFVGLDYSNIRLTFDEEVDSFDKDETDEFTQLDLNVTYTVQMNQDWRFAAQVTPGISSNLKTRLEWEDFVFSGVIAFIKDKKGALNVKKPYRIILGASFSGNGGIRIPIPFISFYKKFHQKWSFNVGAPVSNLQYHASQRVRFKLFATLDGFNANLQREQVLSDGQVANRIRLNMILLGTRYEYKFSDHIESFLTITRSFNPVIQLRQDRERLLSLSTKNVMHYRIGVRFKI